MPLALHELLCRACLHEDELMVDIYEEVEELQVDLCALLERCGDIKVERTDAYPKYLCQECTWDLLNAAKFRKKCADTQLLLTELENMEITEQANNGVLIEQPTEEPQAEQLVEECFVSDENELIVFDENEEVSYEIVNPTADCVISAVETIATSNCAGNSPHLPLDDAALTATQSGTIVPKVKRQEQISTKKEFHVPHRFRCPHCSKSCQSNASLTLHLRVHNGERPFVCDVCPRSFKTNNALLSHQRAHIQLSEHQCPYCEKNFTETSNLKRHIVALHTNERSHTCSICQRSFSRKFVLDLHMRTHTGERPYACSRCNRRFAQLGVLRNHERTHTGEHLHCCGVCQKRFSRLIQLKQHERRHIKQLAILDEPQILIEEQFEDAANFITDCGSVS